MLITIFKNGENQPPLFFANTAKKWVETQDIDKTLAEFNGTDFNSGEGQETNIQRICPDLSAQFTEFALISDTVFAPIFEYKVAK